ncbi:MAG: hypothetical protein U9M97_02155 [Candidatus Hadarchaeota archaeon]|nr:hypothetical protein [Candidatus Hadarchaeota archaeon]
MSMASNSEKAKYRVLGSESLREDLGKLPPLRERIIRGLHRFGETGREYVEREQSDEKLNRPGRCPSWENSSKFLVMN